MDVTRIKNMRDRFEEKELIYIFLYFDPIN